MATITITDLTRCAGGNHYAVTCDVDGEPHVLEFETADLTRRKLDAELLSKIVLSVVLDEINTVRASAGGRGATLAEERTAVVGKTIESRVPVETDTRRVQSEVTDGPR